MIGIPGTVIKLTNLPCYGESEKPYMAKFALLKTELEAAYILLGAEELNVGDRLFVSWEQLFRELTPA